MRFFIIRHGETPWNVQGRFQGRNDIPLNERGVEQARAAAKALEGVRFDAIWSSPLSRALETARAVAGASREVRTHPGLLEISHGLWEGLLAVDVEERWPGVLDQWHREPHTVTMPGGGESLLDVQVRTLRAVDEIREAGGEQVLIAAHDAVIKVLLCAWMEMPLSGFWRFMVGNGSLTLVEDSPTGPRMTLMGDTCHLGDPFFRPDQAGL